MRTFIYPALQLPYPELCFDDQFAFQPIGSTTAMVIALLHTVRKMLSTDQYVHVFSFDFTKVYRYTVQASSSGSVSKLEPVCISLVIVYDKLKSMTLMNKMAQLNIPDNIYNWIKAFFEQHFHCTRYAGECSMVAAVKASVIQGSGLGPAVFIVTAADLHPTMPGNRIFKFADYTYLVVPAANSSSRMGEVSHVEAWASRNNLRLNRT